MYTVLANPIHFLALWWEVYVTDCAGRTCSIISTLDVQRCPGWAACTPPICLWGSAWNCQENTWAHCQENTWAHCQENTWAHCQASVWAKRTPLKVCLLPLHKNHLHSAVCVIHTASFVCDTHTQLCVWYADLVPCYRTTAASLQHWQCCLYLFLQGC